MVLFQRERESNPVNHQPGQGQLQRQEDSLQNQQGKDADQ
jgi:hypothetical protein